MSSSAPAFASPLRTLVLVVSVAGGAFYVGYRTGQSSAGAAPPAAPAPAAPSTGPADGPGPAPDAPAPGAEPTYHVDPYIGPGSKSMVPVVRPDEVRPKTATGGTPAPR